MRGGRAPLQKPTMSSVLDFYDVEYVEHRMGWQSLKCCFHDEATPSLRVNVDEGAFQCIACGQQGGDTFAFIMAREQCDFPKAKEIAETIPGERSGTVSPGRRTPVSLRG